MMVNSKILKSKAPVCIVQVCDTFLLFLRFFFVRHSQSGPTDSAPFFIVGSGRSGNTLLRSLLVASGDVVIPPESYVIPRIIRKFSYLNFLKWEDLSSLIISQFESNKEFGTWNVDLSPVHRRASKYPKKMMNLSSLIEDIYREYARQNGFNKYKRWGDKTPINTIYIDKILKIFIDPQVIHIVRDPRDVVSSYLKSGLYDDFELALKFWIESVKKTLLVGKSLGSDKYIEIKYEELVLFPNKILFAVTEFLNISYTDDMLLFFKQSCNMGDVATKPHHRNLYNPLNSDSIGKWKEVLSSQQANKLVNIVNRHKLTQYFYE